jgi:peptide deformylase
LRAVGACFGHACRCGLISCAACPPLPVKVLMQSLVKARSRSNECRLCSPVAIDEGLPAIAQRMLEIMREEEGIGLAAPQVGLAWRMFVLDVPRPKDDGRKRDPMTVVEGAQAWSDGPLVFVNPIVEASEGVVEPSEEGCLSLPEVRCKVLRPPVVQMSAVDATGQPFRVRASGLLARCMQHEFDHIEGVLLLDRMSPMDRLKNRKIIKDLERE